VHTVFARGGVGIMAAVQPHRGQKKTRTWGADMLIAVAHDPLIHQRPGNRRVGIGRNSLTMQESVNFLDVVGKVHAICEAPPSSVMTRVELYTLSGARSGLDFLVPRTFVAFHCESTGFPVAHPPLRLASHHITSHHIIPRPSPIAAEMYDAAPDPSIVGKKRGAQRMAGASRTAFRADPSFGQTRRTSCPKHTALHGPFVVDQVLLPAHVRFVVAAPVILNELAVQHEPALVREFLVLTSEGLLRYRKVRPVDQLRHILRSMAFRDEGRHLAQFFQGFNPAEACCMCLYVPFLLHSGCVGGVLEVGNGCASSLTIPYNVPQCCGHQRTRAS